MTAQPTTSVRPLRSAPPVWTGRLVLAVAFLTAALALGGCTSSSSTATPTAVTPTPEDLLSSAATTMSEVTSTHFTLAVDGQLAALTVQKAEGDLTAAGDAKGTASIVQLGQLIEAEFVLVDDELYLKGPTGGFTQVPAALAGAVYDPSAILNSDKGVAKVLSSVTNPTITGTSGDAWVVNGTVPAAVAGGLVPGLTTDVDAQFTITMSGAQLTAASFTLDGDDGKPAIVTVELSELNAPVSITAPG